MAWLDIVTGENNIEYSEDRAPKSEVTSVEEAASSTEALPSNPPEIPRSAMLPDSAPGRRNFCRTRLNYNHAALAIIAILGGISSLGLKADSSSSWEKPSRYEETLAKAKADAEKEAIKKLLGIVGKTYESAIDCKGTPIPTEKHALRGDVKVPIHTDSVTVDFGTWDRTENLSVTCWVQHPGVDHLYYERFIRPYNH